MRYLACGALLPLLAAACSAPALTESQEYYVGRGVAANAMFDKNGRLAGLYPDAELEKYVSLVGWTVALESDRPELFQGYHFAVIPSEDVNAFASPSGFIFLTLGALQRMESEDELAAVLAHEIAHVNLRHPEDHANRATAQRGLMDLLGAVGGAASVVLRAAGRRRTAEDLQTLTKGFGEVLDEYTKEIMVNGYGRESELQADALAVGLLSRPGVGYDPRALKAFVERLPKKERGAWSTHPELEGRVQAIDQEIAKRGATPATDPARTARFKKYTNGIPPRR